MCWEITILKLLPYFPGANVLIQFVSLCCDVFVILDVLVRGTKPCSITGVYISSFLLISDDLISFVDCGVVLQEACLAIFWFFWSTLIHKFYHFGCSCKIHRLHQWLFMRQNISVKISVNLLHLWYDNKKHDPEWNCRLEQIVISLTYSVPVCNPYFSMVLIWNTWILKISFIWYFIYNAPRCHKTLVKSTR